MGRRGVGRVQLSARGIVAVADRDEAQDRRRRCLKLYITLYCIRTAPYLGRPNVHSGSVWPMGCGWEERERGQMAAAAAGIASRAFRTFPREQPVQFEAPSVVRRRPFRTHLCSSRSVFRRPFRTHPRFSRFRRRSLSSRSRDTDGRLFLDFRPPTNSRALPRVSFVSLARHTPLFPNDF